MWYNILTLSNLNQFVKNRQQVLLNANHQPVLTYPGFGLLEYSQNDGNSSYNGLDLTVERRFTAGLSMRFAYTWWKSVDDTAEQLSVYGSNAFPQITNERIVAEEVNGHCYPRFGEEHYGAAPSRGDAKPLTTTQLLPS
jgi:hypothetical protein